MNLIRNKVALGVLGWTLMGLFFGTQNYVDFAYAGTPLTWADALSQGFSEAFIWAVLTPVILWLAQRFRLERRNWVWRLPIHGVAAIVVAQLHVGLFSVVMETIPWIPSRTPEAAEVLSGLLVYLVVVGISHGLNTYDRFRKRELRSSRLETQLARARLDLLRAQLQPHFLFNSMHAISELMHEDLNRAEKMITDLSDLLRLSFEHAGQQEATLRKEVEFIERYLDVERTRFQDRLEVHMKVPPELLDASVPYLVLQPLVENAIRHGIEKQRGPCLVEVKAERNGSWLELEVRDTGPGLPAGWNGEAQGVGLKNTRERLEQLYGERHLFELEAVDEGGACARVRIPLELEAANADQDSHR